MLVLTDSIPAVLRLGEPGADLSKPPFSNTPAKPDSMMNMHWGMSPCLIRSSPLAYFSGTRARASLARRGKARLLKEGSTPR